MMPHWLHSDEIIRCVALLPRRRAKHIMGMPATLRRWRREEVLALIDQTPLHSPRYELVDGELLVTPSPGGLHQIAVLALARALDDYCVSEGIGETFVSPFDAEIEPGTLVQPDVFVVPPDEARRLRMERTARTLLLAAEIISPGSERGDRGQKRKLYQRHVPVYWIVDVEARMVERWLPRTARPDVLREHLDWDPAGARQPFRLELHSYFARVYGEGLR